MPFRVRLSLDPHPFSRGGSVAICAVSLLHFIQATLYLYSDVAGNATPLRGLLYVFWAFGIAPKLAIPILMVSAMLGLVGALCRLGWIRLAIFLPQHLCLGIMAGGGVFAAWQGAYLDGTALPWVHILVDQIPVSAIFLVHTSAIVRRARDPNG
jgi:hypothetical protein